MSTVVVECPSGLVHEAKRMGGEETIVMGDRKGATRAAAAVNAILTTVSNCWTETLEPGPYPFVTPGRGKPQVKRLSWADILFSLVAVRRASFPSKRHTLGFVLDAQGTPDDRPIGDVLDFDFNCRGCGKIIEWSVDLAIICAQRVQMIEPDVADAISRSRPLRSTIPLAGKWVEWTYSTPELDDSIRELMKREQRSTETDVERVAKHLVRVEGLDKADLRSLWRWAKALDQDDLDYLAAEIRDRQPSFDNEEIVTCYHPNCGIQQTVVLPFGNQPFFSPRAAPQAVRAMEQKRAAERAAREKERETGSGSPTPTMAPPS